MASRDREAKKRGGAPQAAAAPRPAAPRASAWERPLAIVVSTFATLVERFGFAFAVFCAILAVIYLFGNETTRNDFIREVLFQEITKKPYITIFFGILVLNALFGFSNWVGRRRSESAEMKRLADEKSRLQEKLLGVPLHHTADTGDAPAGARTRVVDGAAAAPDPPAVIEEEHEDGVKRSVALGKRK